MPFNIGSQQAGVVNNVEGNQTIRGGQTGGLDPRALLDLVRQDLAAAHLPTDLAAHVHTELDAIDGELGKSQPNRQAAASRLGRIIGTLKSSGILATVGTGLLASLTALMNSFG
jgi:hypothetical protein